MPKSLDSTGDAPLTIAFDGAVATLTLNRPDSYNSYSEALHHHFIGALTKIAEDQTVRAVIITGAGKAFCSGQDLSDPLIQPGENGEAPQLGTIIKERYNPLIEALVNLPLPTVALVNGVAAGAGMSIALACDIVVASEKAKFIQAFAGIGLIPDSGSTFILPRLIGTARAKAAMMLGEPITAKQAEDWGLIWQCLPADELAAKGHALAQKLAAMPTKALALTKQAVHLAAQQTLSEQLVTEWDYQGQAGASQDYREGLAAFFAKRPPKFTGQ